MTLISVAKTVMKKDVDGSNCKQNWIPLGKIVVKFVIHPSKL